MGHISVVIESLASMGQIEPTDPPSLFAFFKGVSQASPGADGLFEVDVPGGLPLGVYRLSSIVSAANHQPILTPVATRGAVDDTVYVGHPFVSFNGHLTFVQFNVVPANQTAGSVTSLGTSGISSSTIVASGPTVCAFSHVQRDEAQSSKLCIND